MYSSSQADNLRSALLDDPIISNLTLDIDTSETSLLRGKKPLRSLDIEDGADENTDVNDDDTLEMLDALKATVSLLLLSIPVRLAASPLLLPFPISSSPSFP